MLPGIAKKRLDQIRAARDAEAGTKLLPDTFEGFLREVLRLDRVDPQRPERPVLFEAQWVLIRVVFDGKDPVDLESESERNVARQMFGPVERVPRTARHTIAMLKGARIGGTWLWSLYLLYRALTADLSGLGFGESAFAPVVAERLELGYQSINYIKGALKEADLDHLRTNDAVESVRIQRPDGRIATIQAFAASRGGAATRSRTYFAALLDEACFFRASGNGVVNDLEIHRSVAARATVAGSLVGVVSTAWAEEGLLWDLVKENLGTPGAELHGRQETALACITPTELMRQDDTIKAVIRIARDTDPENAAREFDCVPLSQNTAAFFEQVTINAAVDAGNGLPSEFLPQSSERIGAGVDTGLKTDSSAIVIVHEENDVISVAHVREMRPDGNPLKLSEVCAEYSGAMRRHKTATALADQHELEASQEHMAKDGCQLEAAPGGAHGKVESYTLARAKFREGKIRIPACHEKLIRQLAEVRSKALEGGNIKIWSPRLKTGHGDLVSALVNAIWQLQQPAPATYDPSFDDEIPLLRM